MSASKTMSRGLDYYKDGHFLEARRLLVQALDEATSAENLEISMYALQMWLAYVNLQIGDYKAAQKCIDNASKCANKVIAEPVLEEYAKLADIETVQWRLYSLMEQHQEAIEAIAKLVEEEKERYGADSLHYANAINAHGLILAEAGQTRDAEPLFRRAMSIRERVLGADNDLFADSLNSLSFNYGLQNNFTVGLVYAEKALAMRLKHMQPEHVMVGSSFYVRGGYFLRLNKSSKAEADYRAALKIFEKELLPNHPHISYSLSGIGQALSKQGKFKEAIEFLERSVSIADKAQAQKNKQLSASVGALGQAYLGAFKFKEAEEQFKRALELCENSDELKVSHERALLDSVMLSSLMQGKIGDVAQAYPASMRAKYTSSLQNAVNLMDAVVEFGKKQLPARDDV